MAFRLVRLSTGDDGQSHVTTGEITLEALDELNTASSVEAVSRLRFEETRPGSALTWHPAPERQYVVTLSGTLDFETRDGTRFRLGPGDVLLAEDTAGGGHRWRLVDDQPWRRVYIAFCQLTVAAVRVSPARRPGGRCGSRRTPTGPGTRGRSS